jgi:hypothetical protein
MTNFLNPTPSVGAAGTQAKRMWNGVYTAAVVSTQDPLKQSRVTLTVPQVLGTATSNWAVPIGYEPVIPVVNQIVWAMFLGGDVNQPLYLYASTTNTTTAVPGLPTVTIINGVTITDSTITSPTVNDGTLNNPVINGASTDNLSLTSTAVSQSASSSLGTSTTGSGTAQTIDTSMTSASTTGLVDTTGINLASSSANGTTSNATGSLNYTLAAGGTVSPVSWGATGASVIGNVQAANPSSSTTTALTAASWTSGSLQNGWANQGGANVVFRYRLAPFNSVEIIGVINGTSASSSQFFQLPTGYRPATQQPVCTATNTSWVTGFVQCDTSGDLTLQASSYSVADPWVFHGFVALTV